MFFKKKADKNGKKLWEDYFKALLKQEFPKALALLNSLKEMEPENFQVHMKIGDILQRSGDVQGSVDSYYKAASIITKEGFGHKAIAIYKIILRLKPNDTEAVAGTNKLLQVLESSKASPSTAIAASEDFSIGAAAPFEEQPSGEEAPQWGMPEEAQPPYQEEEQPSGEEAPQWSMPEEQSSEGISGVSGLSVIPPIFSSLSKQDLALVLNKAESRSYTKGKAVVEEGDSGNSMFIIKKGKAKVVSHILGKTFELATLSEGDVFGEVAFLTGRPRTASVYAEGDLEVLDISHPSFQDILDSNPQILDSLVKFYYSRVQDTIKKIKPG